MLAISVKELLAPDTREITLQDTYWPESFIDVVDVVQHELINHLHLVEVARATLLQFCMMWGGSYLHIPTHQKMSKFIVAKHLYDASLLGNNHLDIAITEANVKQSEVMDSVSSQHELHTLLNDDRPGGKRASWRIETLHIIDQLNDYLADINFSSKERLLIRQAILLALSKMRGNGVINVPSCNGISIEIRKRLIFNQFTGNNARFLARKFNISLAHVHRSIQSEYKRRRKTIA